MKGTENKNLNGTNKMICNYCNKPKDERILKNVNGYFACPPCHNNFIKNSEVYLKADRADNNYEEALKYQFGEKVNRFEIDKKDFNIRTKIAYNQKISADENLNFATQELRGKNL